MINRRTFIPLAAILAAVGLTSLTQNANGADVQTMGKAIPDEYKQGGFAIGCQAYTFNRYTIFEAIEKTAEAGGKIIEFYADQKLSTNQTRAPQLHDAPQETLDQINASLAAHHILAVNYGVVGIPKDEARARKIFEFAKKMGLRGI